MYASARTKSSLLLLSLAASLSAANVPLKLFRNYFVTGDYAVGGIGLQGKGAAGNATGNVVIAGVPADATVLAAWLYWETMEKNAGDGKNGMFNGNAVAGTAVGTVTSPCQVLAKVTIFRADVLQFLPRGANSALYGVNFNPNGTFPVTLPDSGDITTAPSTMGASLVVVWSKPGQPFRSVILFDGAFTIAPPTLSMSVNLTGFDQALTAGPTARITHIVGNGGGANTPSDVLFNNTRLGANPNNIFTSAQGPGWDNPSFDVSALLPGDAATATTGSDTNLLAKGVRRCLTWSAIVMSTTVQDTDGDGLLDTWEKNGFKDSDNTTVDLKAMGANPNKKDIFIEIDYMNAGAGEAAAGHKPKQAALDRMCAAFAARNIAVHFDIGQGAGGIVGNACTSPNAGFSGGNAIAHSNVVNFKTNTANANPDFSTLKAANFANNRRFLFHYALWGHQYAIGGGASTSSGVADLPGGDLMVTLGAFTHPGNAADTMVGTLEEQAGTMMHEFGHNLFLHHAGTANTPNFIPQYQSVMNYGYQMILLQNAAGKSTLDYSRENLGALNENTLNEGAGVGNATYRTRYVAAPNAVDNFLINKVGLRNYIVPDPRNCVGNVVVRQTITTNGAVDWNNSLLIEAGNVTQDIGGNCGLDNHTGSDDWAAVDLRQTGSRPNYVVTTANFPNNPNSQDIAYEDYILQAPPNPADLSALSSVAGVILTWSPVDLTIVTNYDVYRFPGTDPIAAALSQTIQYLGSTTAALTTFSDATTSAATQYTYFIQSASEFNNASAPSNFVTVVTP